MSNIIGFNVWSSDGKSVPLIIDTGVVINREGWRELITEQFRVALNAVPSDGAAIHASNCMDRKGLNGG